MALGGCDIRIASPKAKMGFNFVKIGLHPGKKCVLHLIESVRLIPSEM